MGVAIRTEGLTKVYGRLRALDDLDLEVPEGVVFGYLGPNGSGKSTTIRMLVGLLRPTAGRATVLGHDVVDDRLAVQSLVGYLPGDFAAPPRLTGREYLRYLTGLRRTHAMPEAELLAKRLGLDLDRRIGELSHGNRQKVGLVQAFMHHPPVLVLDEPTSGLDPLVQREFLAMVREARDAGTTVLLSSHVLSEVEAVADVVAILREGCLVAVESTEDLRRRARRHVDLTFADSPPATELAAVPGVQAVTVLGHTASVLVEGSMQELWQAAAPHGIEDVTSHEADLEEIFLTYYSGEGQP